MAAALLGLSSGKRRYDLAYRTVSVASEEELEAILGEGSLVGLNFVPAIVKDPEHSDGKHARGNRRPAKAVGQFRCSGLLDVGARSSARLEDDTRTIAPNSLAAD